MLRDGQLLAVAVSSLAVGPALAWIWPAGRAWRAFLDGLSLTLVGGLCLLHLAPHAVAEGGLPALALGAVGFLGPALLHRSTGRGARFWVVASALTILVHSVIDGATLAVAGELRSVGLAVAAHQVPVGLGIWTLAAHGPGLGRWSGPWLGWLSILALMAATLLGYAAGAPIDGLLPEAVESGLEALVAGALLHVVFDAAGDHSHAAPAGRRLVLVPGADHAFVRTVQAPVVEVHGHVQCHERHHDHGHDTVASRAWSSVGAVLGMIAIGAVSAGGDESVAHFSVTMWTFVSLALAGAPALLLGYLAAGVAAALAPESSGAWLQGREPLGQSLRGVVFGLPLPVCSCGVLPLYESLVRRGIPATAALALLVATPGLGADAVLFGVPLLGWPFAVARLLAALGVAVAVALLVGHGVPSGPARAQARVTPATPPLRARLWAGLRFGFVELVDHTLPWVVLGLGVAALVEPLFAHDVFARLPSVVQVPVLALFGVPLYLCASGATPLAAMAVHKGASAGAVLAFLLAGPATNLATFTVLRRLHGTGAALRFGLAVVAIAVLVGWSVDLLGVPVAPLLHVDPAPASRPFASISAVALGALALASLFRQGIRGMVGQILEPTHSR
jgi:uncharacterized membrane protein YraQ (UPF0718 family)